MAFRHARRDGKCMSDDGVKYEMKTVRALRGTEARVIAKWEKEGWELVSQTPQKLQAEIVMRRAKAAASRRTIVLVGSLVLVVIGAIVTGVILEQGPDGTPTSSDAAITAEAPTATGTPLEEPATTDASDDAAEVITPETNPDFTALLALGDYCDASVAAFAEQYKGQSVSFDASIGAMNTHDGASTRYDILLGAGDFSETTSPGPAFQFRDVNTTSDLHLAGDVPDSIGVGANLRVTARVDRYEPSSCLVLLDPVETSFR